MYYDHDGELRKKTITTCRGLNYTYYVRPPSSYEKLALLLQHGFPDDHSLWDVIPDLVDRYPIVVADLLEYGGTSKPSNAQVYISKDMFKDLIKILDMEATDMLSQWDTIGDYKLLEDCHFSTPTALWA